MDRQDLIDQLDHLIEGIESGYVTGFGLAMVYADGTVGKSIASTETEHYRALAAGIIELNHFACHTIGHALPREVCH